MTRKEAVVIQKAIRENLHETGKDFPYRDEMIPVMKESCDMAIKALEQQPCEEAIGRDMAIANIQELAKWHTRDAFNADRVTRCLKTLPPVQPKPKTGYWIDADGDNAICSCCNRLNHLYGTYCKHCGAKMEVEKA